jgi:hypothetical protein
LQAARLGTSSALRLIVVVRTRAALQAAKPADTILATDSIERFVRIGTRFLQRPVDSEEVELIDL